MTNCRDRIVSWGEGRAWLTRSGSVQCGMSRRIVRRLTVKPVKLRWKLYGSGRIVVQRLRLEEAKNELFYLRLSAKTGHNFP